MPNKETSSQSSTEKPTTHTEREVKRAFHSKDEKPAGLFSTLPYYSLILLYAWTYVSVEVFKQPWLGVFLVYVILPLSDIIFPEDWLNPTEPQNKKLLDDIYFKIPLYVTSVVDWIFLFWSINHLVQQPFNLLYWSGMLLISSSLLASNFLVSHELFHKHDSLGRFIGCTNMIKSHYTHFFIEHQYGHHKHVATPKDAASAVIGQTLYDFIPKTMKHTFFSAWEIEKRRLIDIEECSTHWHPKNRMLWYMIASVVFAGFVYYNFGLIGLIISLIIAFQSVIFLEAINYIEHYGLRRKEISPGEYEKVNITHSWNAPHRITNYVLFKLQRHSDHHENGYKPYQTLATYDASPMLPNGYAFCISLCFFPSSWFSILDAYVIRYNKGEKITAEEEAKTKIAMKKYLTHLVAVFSILVVLGYIFRP